MMARTNCGKAEFMITIGPLDYHSMSGRSCQNCDKTDAFHNPSRCFQQVTGCF